MCGTNKLLDGSLDAALARVNAKVVKAVKLGDVKVPLSFDTTSTNMIFANDMCV